jgi:hypothetical protein
MKFRLGDTVRVINRTNYHFDRVGRITSRCKDPGWGWPFLVSGLDSSVPLWYRPEELILAEQEQP